MHPLGRSSMNSCDRCKQTRVKCNYVFEFEGQVGYWGPPSSSCPPPLVRAAFCFFGPAVSSGKREWEFLGFWARVIANPRELVCNMYPILSPVHTSCLDVVQLALERLTSFR
jgi:hypothetical protein